MILEIRKKLKAIPVINRLYIKIKWREHKVSWGNENPDKVFFVIRRATCKVGLFSYVMTNMGLVKQAVEKGYIPVIDMQNNANSYLEENEVGRKNAWEFYFEQPEGYSLSDITKSRNVILSNGLITSKNCYPGKEIITERESLKIWRDFFLKYLKVKKEIRDEAEFLYQTAFGKERVLGVLCRGTDYRNTHPKNHPVQPEPDEVIRKAWEVMEEFSCTRIYLATEDDDIFQKFKDAFGRQLWVTEAKRYANTGTANINDMEGGRENERYLKGKEYLINILLLTQCDCLVAGSAGGTYGALLMSEKYEYEYVYNLGLYDADD